MKIKIIIFPLIIILSIISIVLVKNNKKTSVNYEQWGLLNDGQKIKGVKGKKGFDININPVWNITFGNSETIVGILDTGIDISNTQIKDSIFINEKEIPNNNIDDDKNNFIDDVNGWDFYNNDNSVYDDYVSDYHGTFITSIIGSSHNNQMKGIAPKIKILPLKFMRNSEGITEEAIEAIKYAHEMGVKIINCSWDSEVYDKDLYNCLKEYNDILFVCSSGKKHSDLNEYPVYPACFNLDNVVCVSAANNLGEINELSGYNYNKEIIAPGENILGIFPENDYGYAGGSSFATAYVTGIASLVKSEYPNISTKELAKLLVSSKNNVDGKTIIDAKICFLKAKKKS